MVRFDIVRFDIVRFDIVRFDIGTSESQKVNGSKLAFSDPLNQSLQFIY